MEANAKLTRTHEHIIKEENIFLLALQPFVDLYFAALQRGYSLLAYEVS